MITPWKLNIALDKLPCQKENSFPTIIYQGQAVKLRECTFKKNFLRRWIIFPFEGWWEYSTLENYHGTPKWKLGRWFKKDFYFNWVIFRFHVNLPGRTFAQIFLVLKFHHVQGLCHVFACWVPDARALSRRSRVVYEHYQQWWRMCFCTLPSLKLTFHPWK